MPRHPLFLCFTVLITVAAQVSAISTCHAQGPTSLRDALGITAANPDVSVDFDFDDANYFIDDGNWSLIGNEFSNGTFDIRSGATLTTAGSRFRNLSVLGDLTLADRFTGSSVVNGGFSLDGTWSMVKQYSSTPPKPIGCPRFSVLVIQHSPAGSFSSQPT